jgi:hypothetical protein
LLVNKLMHAGLIFFQLCPSWTATVALQPYYLASQTWTLLKKEGTCIQNEPARFSLSVVFILVVTFFPSWLPYPLKLITWFPDFSRPSLVLSLFYFHLFIMIEDLLCYFLVFEMLS